MQEIIRAYEASIDSVLEGERAVVARINSAAVDRLRTVIDPMGGDTSHFNKTRSVLWNHGQDAIRGAVPVGSGWVKVRKAERDIIGKTSFAKDEFSQLLFEGYRDETIRGWSIKAAVLESSPPTKEEIRNRPEMEDCEMVYRKWDLIEYSATPTPGNSDCLTLLVSRGLITPPEGFVMPEKPSVIEQPKPEVGRRIECDGSYWHVIDCGKRIASFPDAEDADELIRAMDKTRSFEQVLVNLHTEQQARFAEMEERIVGMIELKKFGRI